MMLRDFIAAHGGGDRSTMSALSNNIYTVLLTIIYVKCGLETASVLRWRMGKRRVPRMFVLLCMSTTIFFWPLYDTSDWSWRLNCVVPCTVATRLFYKVRVQLRNAYYVSGRNKLWPFTNQTNLFALLCFTCNRVFC